MEYIGLAAMAMVLVPILELRHLRKRCNELERDGEALFRRMEALESRGPDAP